MKVLAREYNTWQMKIRETAEIRTHQSKLNTDNEYDLRAIYDIYTSVMPMLPSRAELPNSKCGKFTCVITFYYTKG